jgi:hypothetical protein
MAGACILDRCGAGEIRACSGLSVRDDPNCRLEGDSGDRRTGGEDTAGRCILVSGGAGKIRGRDCASVRDGLPLRNADDPAAVCEGEGGEATGGACNRRRGSGAVDLD